MADIAPSILSADFKRLERQYNIKQFQKIFKIRKGE